MIKNKKNNNDNRYNNNINKTHCCRNKIRSTCRFSINTFLLPLILLLLPGLP